jgi:hypothetical protein
VNLADTVSEVEATGATFRIEGEKVRIWYPDENYREKLTEQIAFLRNHRADVAAFLKARGAVPDMPPGVRLIQWNLKAPPVLIETYAVVTDPTLFARTTLEQLKRALENPKRWMGWTTQQLVDRLAHVGVTVILQKQ